MYGYSCRHIFISAFILIKPSELEEPHHGGIYLLERLYW